MEFHSNDINKIPVVDLTKPVMVSMESFSLIDMKSMANIDEENKEMDISLIETNTISRNGSHYGFDAIQDGMDNGKYVQEGIQQGCWKGEGEHPSPESPMWRILHVEPTRVVWRILKYWTKGDEFKGRVRFIPPMGDTYFNWVLGGQNIAASIRSRTPNYVKKNQNGRVYYDKVKPIIIRTFDAVDFPGLEKARAINPNTFVSKEMYSFEGLYQREYNAMDELSEMVTSCEGMKYVQEVYGFDINEAKMKIAGNKGIVSLENQGISLEVPISTYLLSKMRK